jgi:hypothetical protein
MRKRRGNYVLLLLLQLPLLPQYYSSHPPSASAETPLPFPLSVPVRNRVPVPICLPRQVPPAPGELPHKTEGRCRLYTRAKLKYTSSPEPLRYPKVP